MRKLSAEWVRNAWTRIKNVNAANRLSNFWIFFSAIQMISCCDRWPWTKPVYITITRRQSNNQWSGGIAAHRTPKNSESKNPLEKFSPQFLGIKTAYSSLIIFQRDKLSMWSITHLCGCDWRTFWKKYTMGWECHQEDLVLARQWPCSPGTCNPEETPTWASSVLITHPVLLICPHWTTTSSLDWKNNWKVAIFRPTWRSLLLQRPG